MDYSKLYNTALDIAKPGGFPSVNDAVRYAVAAKQAQLQAAAPSDEVQLVPKWAGQFHSYQDWVNKAQSRLASPDHRRAMCVDAKGRRCAIGADFMLARDEDAFPVRYFWECELAVAPAQPAPQALLDHAHAEPKISLSGHQLRMALDLINPDGPSDELQMEDELTFGIVQHKDDDGEVSTGMCCWNGDTDGVLPLDGEYSAPMASADAVIEAKKMAAIGKLIREQDNRITDAPIFVVEQKTPVVSDSDYNDCRIEWRETENGDYQMASPERAARLEALHEAGRDTQGWRRYEVTDIWTFVTACFTEQGCKDYLARNGHNLRETRIYAYGSYRNEEFRAIRNYLISRAAQPTMKGAGE